MTVTRVHTATGSHIEPPLDTNWSKLEKLRWHAAVVLADTGVEMSIDQIGADFSARMGGPAWSSSRAATSYEDVWTFINGVSVGAKAKGSA